MPDPKRRPALLALTAVVIVVAAAAAGWWWFDGRWTTSTDDAYVQGNLVQLTPQIAGIVIRINADDTALVREGDPVVVLDDADTRTALDEAKAGLAQAVRRVRQLYANTDALRASVELRRAEWRRAREDLQRRTGLPDARALAEEELKHAQTQVETAAAALRVAEQQLAASEAMVSRTTVATHPDVRQAAAKLRESYLAAQRASVLAPVTGYVARRSVQLGQQVAPGAPLLAIVPLAEVWVDANFKETQLQYVRIGQPATLTSDLYGGAVTYRGTVIGLGSGTGSAFALLPPQNATGNWIKIVQRLPVRIRLDPQELAAHPLRVGLSINVSIGTSADQGTWVITSFAVSAAIAMPLTGWLGRRYGEVRVFLVCTAMFTIASLLCGLSANLAMLIAMRAIQGVFGGPMIPLSQSLLLNNYPDDRKSLALALLMMVTIVAPVLGPILGGWITDNWNWAWIFYINVPIGIVATLLTAALLRGRETSTARVPADVVGIALLALGVGSLQIMLDRGKDLDWFASGAIVALAALALVALAFFVAWELTDRQPAVDLTLFARRNFTAGTAALCLGFCAYFGNIVLLPLWLQTQMGYTATWAGLASAPVGLLPIALVALIARYTSGIDLRWITTASLCAFGAASFWFAGFNTEVSFPMLAWSRFAQGVGLALFFVPLMSIVLSGLPPGRVASASGLANTLRTLAGSFATSLTTTWWDRREALHQAPLSESITLFNPPAQGQTAFATLERSIVQQAYMLATNDLFWLWGWTFLALIAVVWFARPPFSAAAAHAAAD